MPRISYQQIQQNIAEIANRDAYESTVIYDLLLAYGKPKATITKLQGGINNFAKDDGVLLKDTVFFKVFPAGTVLESKVEQLKHDELTERYRPRYLIATDLQNIAAYDRRQEASLSTKIRDLDKDFTFFYGLSGNEVNTGQKEEAYADRKAAERMKELYDEIVKCNTQRIIDKDLNFRHDLNIFFSRLLFCYFAEDTDLFEPKQFTNSIKNYTKLDGSDTPYFFEQLFKSLDSKPYEKQDMPDPFNKFPYVNGTIFDTKQHSILIPQFNAQAHHLLIQLAESDWSDVNPDIFGTIFQGIVDAQKRDENGMDYTSVTNIEKVINPLFMDDLWAEYDKAKDNINKLNKLWVRISKIKIFDPACGSGNFLIIAYKRLRELEQEIIRTIDEISPAGIGIRLDSQIKLDHFFGIELEDFPRELAVLSMFIAAHQMNIKFEEEFGKKLTIIPIIDMPTIICGNSARLDWNSVCPNNPHEASSAHMISMFDELNDESEPQKSEAVYDEIYVIGNPPYKGADEQTPSMKSDLDFYFRNEDYSKNIDYVGLWFIKGSRYIKNTNARLAFVTTDSVCQGEHVSIMFPKIFNEKVEIGFAYESFKWANNAKDNAQVMVTVIGLRNVSKDKKYIYEKTSIKAVSNINPYLIEGDNIIVEKTRTPINGLPNMVMGSMARTKNLVLSKSEKDKIISDDPAAVDYIKRFMGTDELNNGKDRYCIWVDSKNYSEADKINSLHERFEAVRKERMDSKAASTRAMAVTPYKFAQISYEKKNAIIVSTVNKASNPYILASVVDENIIISNLAFAIYTDDLHILPLIMSKMNIVWAKCVCGKRGEGIRYSNTLGYNTLPVPPLTPNQKDELRESALDILMARENHTEMTLAQMYDPKKMPEDLRAAHHKNDILVEKLYQPKAFLDDEERLAKLFAMYNELTKDK